MTAIFISYRREDSSGHAGRLCDSLRKEFGASNVFMDVDDIDLGIDFRETLKRAVDRCDVMLVVIGPDWLDAVDKDTGKRRIEDPNDWVRIETAEALKRRIPVIPVLVRGAALPQAGSLPGDLEVLAQRQAALLIDRQWAAGIADLVLRLKARPRRLEGEAVQQWIARLGLRRLAVLAVLAGAASLCALWLAWPSSVKVPQLTGLTLAQARQSLEAAGAGVRDVQVLYEESLVKPPGSVVGQAPEAGSSVSRAQAIRLVVAKRPPAVDLSSHVVIRDVGGEGTVAAAAAVMALEAAYKIAHRDVRLSERYLYQKAKKHDETSGGEGTWMTAVVYVAEQFGVPPLAMWPYASGKSSLPPGMTWRQLDDAAAANRAHFFRIGQQSAIYEQLRRGRPVLAAVRIGKEWSTPEAMKTGRISGEDRKPRRADYDGISAVAIVGFDPDAGVLRFANCWGRAWGDQGFGTMTLEAAESLIDSTNMWAVEAAQR